MKKTITIITSIFLSITAAKAQSYWLADMENLVLPLDSFYQNTAGLDFSSNQVNFIYDWNPAWGGYWSGGFAYSTKRDSITSGSVNMYSAKTAKGYNNSNTYVVGQNAAKLAITPVPLGTLTNSCYITNSTFAFNSMRDGDAFGKKFGGVTGNDPDWFKLTIRGSLNGVMKPDSVEFYLADFRFANNAQDYIVKTWSLVDLSLLGMVDTLTYFLSSSDVGAFGMNTPAFFCMDNFSTPQAVGINSYNNLTLSTRMYPTPIENEATIEVESLTNELATLTITNTLGEVITEDAQNLTAGNTILKNNFSNLPQGMYFLSVSTSKGTSTIRFLKN